MNPGLHRPNGFHIFSHAAAPQCPLPPIVYFDSREIIARTRSLVLVILDIMRAGTEKNPDSIMWGKRPPCASRSFKS